MAGIEHLFDEFGNIRPEAEVLSRMEEVKQGVAPVPFQHPDASSDPRMQTEGRFSGLPRKRGDIMGNNEAAINAEDRQQNMAANQEALDYAPQAQQLTQDMVGEVQSFPESYLSPDMLQSEYDPTDAAFASDPMSASQQVPTGIGSEPGSPKGDRPPEIDQLRRLQEDEMLALEAAESQRDTNIQNQKERMDRMFRIFEQADADVKSLRVDPRRWEKETPALTKAMLLIGAGFFGFISKGKGPNPLLNIIDRAIQSDTKAQMANVDIKMQSSKMKLDREFAFQRAQSAYEAALYERAYGMVNKIAMATNHEAQLQRLDLLRQGLLIKNQQAMQKQLQAVRKWDDVKLLERAQGGVQGMAQTKGLYDELRSIGGSRAGRVLSDWAGSLSGGLVWTPEADFSKRQKASGALLAKQMLGYSISDTEGKNFASFYPAVGDPDDVQAIKTLALIRKNYNNLLQDFQSASPNDRKRLAKTLIEAKQQYNEITKDPLFKKAAKDERLKMLGSQIDAWEQGIFNVKSKEERRQ